MEGLKPHSLKLCPSPWGFGDRLIYATGSKQKPQRDAHLGRFGTDEFLSGAGGDSLIPARELTERVYLYGTH